ncbi:hypothetical protein K1W69_07180 [Hoeflea sp. WL0058]|uniref:Uncharacterized protein n=1 Tax=Flavimaribacter sediminis TaxID=2865987 RepID=A0AAE3D0P0_9HYPH|nr:hypothetical protein [Flavimaribacter sediminis]MBW8636966.1 hypothetical protein [Flavimaribacter sediminis]
MNKHIDQREFVSTQIDLHPYISDLISVSCQLSAVYCALGNKEDSEEFHDDLRNLIDQARAKIAATANALDKVDIAAEQLG